MLATHKVIRRSRAHRKVARAALADPEVPFDADKTAKFVAKQAAKADQLEIVDAVGWDLFEAEFGCAMLDWLAQQPFFAAEATKSAYMLLHDKSYQPKLARQILVGASALAMDCMADRVYRVAGEVVRQLFRVRHEDFPGIVDETAYQDVMEMRSRFVAERASGDRVDPVRKGLFGKRAGVPSKERKRLAAEAAAAGDPEAGSDLAGA